jgi:hypothetical protein
MASPHQPIWESVGINREWWPIRGFPDDQVDQEIVVASQTVSLNDEVDIF